MSLQPTATVPSSKADQSIRSIRHKTIKKKHMKRAKRQRQKTLDRLYERMSHSAGEINDTSSADCTVIRLDQSSDKNEDLFFEDRTGDLTVEAAVTNTENRRGDPLQRSKRRSRTPLEKTAKIARRDSTIVLSDDEDLVTTVIPCQSSSPSNRTPSKTAKTTLLSSTPISTKPKTLNISNLSSVQSFSPANKNLSLAKSLKKRIVNLTREINSNDFVTIDITNCSASCDNTVIDLDESRESRSSISTINLTDASSSRESDVTVINLDEWKQKAGGNRTMMRNIVAGIAKMNSSEKGRLFEVMAERIFGGCTVVNKKPDKSKPPASPDDTYIKQVIIGGGEILKTNIYNPTRHTGKRTGLRMVVIDGSNVAMHHGNHNVFSVKGLKICIEFFRQRGHTVKAFVPHFRCKYGKSSDPQLLDHLERRGDVVYTPSMEVNGRTVTSYDDRFIVQTAAEFEGVIVSRDFYRDLVRENAEWRRAIETRHLQFTWVQDVIMFPVDPLGRGGPSLDRFLSH